MTVTHGGNVFALARERGWDWREVLDFSASINPLGPAPGVRTAICKALGRIAHYPEREPERLREALASAWNVEPGQVLVGNGATELLHFFARVYPAGRVTLAVPVFSEFHRAYPDAAMAPAGRPEQWPQEGLLVVTRPVNPTGFALPWPRMCERLAATDQPVLVDESFLDFTPLETALQLLGRRPRLFVLRSLTKFHALPGLRVGALAAARDDIERLRARREPWQVNVLAEEAALAALADREHAARTIGFVAGERAWLFERLAELPGVTPLPGTANYLFAALDYAPGALVAYLLEHKILVRDCRGWPGVEQPGVRIAVRGREENERLLAAWRRFSCSR